jgi:spermidine synthase
MPSDWMPGDRMPVDTPDEDRGVELLGDADRPRAWMLLAGGVPQSYVDLGDPRHLELEYMRRLGHVLDLAAPPGVPLRVLHLGGGALTLARYVAATRPGSAQLAAESDARVARLVAERLPLDQPGRPAAPAGRRPAATSPPPAGPGRISLRVADARLVLEQAPAGSFDVIVADAFAGAQTPGHLTSAEFTAAVLRALAPAGLYAANISDGPPLAHARGRVAAIGAVFSHACVIAEAAVLSGGRFGNLVAVAAGHELPVAELARRSAADQVPAEVLASTALAQFVGGTSPITDARPVPSAVPPPDVFA